MVKITVLYGHPEDPEAFEEYFERGEQLRRERGDDLYCRGRFVGQLFSGERSAESSSIATPRVMAASAALKTYQKEKWT